MPDAKRGKQAGRRERVAAVRAHQERADKRRILITVGAIVAAAALIIAAVVWYAASRSSNHTSSGSRSAQVILARNASTGWIGAGVPGD